MALKAAKYRTTARAFPQVSMISADVVSMVRFWLKKTKTAPAMDVLAGNLIRDTLARIQPWA
jgi:hypothetical protein